eukprot:TRINITY_DN30645_c0_g1_i1.p1 TRINITY_DN30645_c0_g1~~TRINITY_DN30645_c0_g1_i1.p1  ORF type:complete len:419 (+),score=90.29 TRINITY_DN30645_c0_g1_i1:69-1325(+)
MEPRLAFASPTVALGGPLPPVSASALNAKRSTLRSSGCDRLGSTSQVRETKTLLAVALSSAVALRAANRSNRRSRQTVRTVMRRSSAADEQPAASTSTGKEKEVPWGEIAGAIAFALLDIFKPPPNESTGADAPGLREMGVPASAALSKCQVLDVRTGNTVNAAELLKPVNSRSAGIFFLTHWGDFNSWEVAQQICSAVKNKRIEGGSVSLIGIGSVAAGCRFAEMLELPPEVKIFADTGAACHSQLKFSHGALPQYSSELNPYFRVFLMLLGVGSPGTIWTVLSGYVGNRSLSPESTVWVDESLRQGGRLGRWPTTVPRLPGDGKMLELAEVGRGVWDEAFGKDGLRPFELATVRLQNMCGGIIANWNDLKPDDDELLVQQGGALIADSNGEAKFYFRDKGILTYVPMEDAIKALQT